MNYILFTQHPGDLITIKNYSKNVINLRIGDKVLKLVKPIKLTNEGYKAFIDKPKDVSKKDINAVLEQMLEDNEIVDFFIE